MVNDTTAIYSIRVLAGFCAVDSVVPRVQYLLMMRQLEILLAFPELSHLCLCCIFATSASFVRPASPSYPAATLFVSSPRNFRVSRPRLVL